MLRSEEARLRDEEANQQAVDNKLAARLAAINSLPRVFCAIYIILGILFLACQLWTAAIGTLVLAVVFIAMAVVRKLKNDTAYQPEGAQLRGDNNRSKVILAIFTVLIAIGAIGNVSQHKYLAAALGLNISLFLLYWLIRSFRFELASR